MMSLTAVGVLLIHSIIVSISGIGLLFATNRRTLIVLTLLVGIVFLQTHVANGCVLAKYEEPIPVVNKTPTGVVKSVIGLETSPCSTADLEKVFVGLTFIAYLGKLGVLFFIDYWFGGKLPKTPLNAIIFESKSIV
jgi:hypothetical protein